MVEPYPVLEVPYGVLAVGVGAMPGVEADGAALDVGDEGVVGVGGEQGQLRAGGGPHPAHYQPAIDPFGAGPERVPIDSGHIGTLFEPVRDGRPGVLGDLRDRRVHVLVQLDGDRETNAGLLAGIDDLFGVEARVGPHL